MDKLNIRKSLLFIYLLVSSFLFYINTAYATRVEYSYGVDTEYSDNSNLVSDLGVDEVRVSPVVGILLQETTSRINADFNGMIEYRDYRNNTFPDETWGHLSTNINLTIRPATFFWILEDYFSQVERDPLSSSTPDNVINTNVFSSGPDLFFRVGSSKRIGIKMRVSEYRFEDTAADSERNSIKLSWLSRVSPSTEWSLNTEYQKAEFTELVNSDFDRADVFFNINYLPSRSSFEAEFGLSSIKPKIGNTVDGYLAKLLWRNQFRQQSFFQLDVSSQYTDSGLDLMTAGSFDRGIDLSGQQITGDIFYNKFIELTYHLNLAESSYEMQVLARNEDYETLLLDRDTIGIRLSYNYAFTNTLQFTSSLQQRDYEYIDIDQLDTEITGNLAIIYRITTNYTLGINYNYIDRESSNPALIYDENRLLISFYYGRHPGSYR